LGSHVLVAIPPKDVESLSDVLAMLFAGIPVCSGQKYNVRAAMDVIKRGEAQLWLLVSTDEDPKFVAGAVTELVDHTDHRTLRMWMAGGDFESLMLDGRDTLNQYGRDEGCRDTEIDGPEWIIEFCERHGFHRGGVTMRKEL
jgi:hypothetical protein